MTSRWAPALALLALASCVRCSTATADAGFDAGQRVRRSTDLRSALLIAFPEYRGAFVTEGHAALTRRYVALPDEAFTRAVEGNGFKAGPDGGLFRAPFHLARPSPSTVVLSMPVDMVTVEKVLQAPLALSSMELGLYLPRGLPVAEERFELALRYQAAPPARAGFLTRQVVELLLGNGQWTMGPVPDGWAPQPGDGGYGAVPESFAVTLTERSSGARLDVARDGGEVHMTYGLVTDAAAP
ncbi:MAG: hypothetical protein AB1938_26785 [Myxococcota bacterium]